MKCYANALFDNDPSLEQRLLVAQRATPGLLTYMSGLDCWQATNFKAVIDDPQYWVRLQVLMGRPAWTEVVHVAGL